MRNLTLAGLTLLALALTIVAGGCNDANIDEFLGFNSPSVIEGRAHSQNSRGANSDSAWDGFDSYEKPKRDNGETSPMMAKSSVDQSNKSSGNKESAASDRMVVNKGNGGQTSSKQKSWDDDWNVDWGTD